MAQFITYQLPVPSPSDFIHSANSIGTLHYVWISPRVLELVFTAQDLQPFARDCGYEGPPFFWNENRRFLLRCELDAAHFKLYGIHRDDVDHIKDSFPIIKRKEEAEHGEYRTKPVILEIYDAMQQAIETGVPYQTRLDPPPANGWTPPEKLLQAAFASTTTYAPATSEPLIVREEQPEFALVSPPSSPKPLLDKYGGMMRVRVYDQAEQIVLNRGVVVGREKREGATAWKVLGEGETEARTFVSPPFVLKRLKGRAWAFLHAHNDDCRASVTVYCNRRKLWRIGILADVVGQVLQGCPLRNTRVEYHVRCTGGVVTESLNRRRDPASTW